MPKLLAFLPCEKLIIEQVTNNVSISTLMQEMNVQVPAKIGPPPKGVMSPQSWAVLAIWHFGADEERIDFEVKTSIVGPDEEEIFISPVALIASPADRNVVNRRLTINATGFPVWKVGLCQLVLLIKNPGEADFSEAARFPIMIHHQIIN